MKAPFHVSFFFLIGVLVPVMSCTRATVEPDRPAATVQAYPDLRNSVMVKGQNRPPRGIQSILLYRQTPDQAPVIELNSNQQLTLKFDDLGFDNRRFRVRFTHHDADWSPSSLLPNFFQRGFSEDYITDSQTSEVQRPAYTHYTYTFPNENIELLASGNYMIEVYDYERDEILFSLPFFVHENTGRIETRIEELYGLDERYLMFHQIFATYAYPEDVIIPDTDLETRFVQNHFWGRARVAGIVDTPVTGQIRSHLARDSSYAGRFEFRSLDLQRLQQEAYNIIEFRPETTPPRVVLMRDVVNLDMTPRTSQSHRFGVPVDETGARYADVYFELEIPRREQIGKPVYVIGPFNNWIINENHRMTYDRDRQSYTGNALVKEGLYDYKYAVVEQGAVNDLRLDASFADSRQVYHTFVYFFDPGLQADRLLMVHDHTTRQRF